MSGRRVLVVEDDPAVVLLDVMLPGFDGHEVCRRIQADRPVPVLMLTARDDGSGSAGAGHPECGSGSSAYDHRRRRGAADSRRARSRLRPGGPVMTAFDAVSSIKVKLGALVAVSVVVVALLATLGSSAGVPVWLTLPVVVLLTLGVTQLVLPEEDTMTVPTPPVMPTVTPPTQYRPLAPSIGAGSPPGMDAFFGAFWPERPGLR